MHTHIYILYAYKHIYIIYIIGHHLLGGPARARGARLSVDDDVLVVDQLGGQQGDQRQLHKAHTTTERRRVALSMQVVYAH